MWRMKYYNSSFHCIASSGMTAGPPGLYGRPLIMSALASREPRPWDTVSAPTLGAGYVGDRTVFFGAVLCLDL